MVKVHSDDHYTMGASCATTALNISMNSSTIRVLACSLLLETDRAAARTDMIGAIAASDRADAGFGAVREALCAVHAHAHPPEGGFYFCRALVQTSKRYDSKPC